MSRTTVAGTEAASPGIPPAWLTPRPGRVEPIHRWFVFPHSYAPQLVRRLLADFDARVGATVLDPCCGAGTTLVEAQELGMRAIGLDLLPIAVLVSRAKTSRPSRRLFEAALDRAVASALEAEPQAPPPGLLRRAFGPATYGHLRAALETAAEDAASRCVKLSVLSIASRFSRLRADGGWLREVRPELPPGAIAGELRRAGQCITRDLPHGRRPAAVVRQADARRMPLEDESVDFVVTSPPYPNRHDYTRVFAVELELAYGLGEEVESLRRQAIHSHPEARPVRCENGYSEPLRLRRIASRIAAAHADPRIPRMIVGYFRDLHDVLVEIRRVLRPGGRAALVVGNARYCGIGVPADELLAEIAPGAGLSHQRTTVLRVRGNSAQQMGRFGRRDSRESVVVLAHRRTISSRV